MITTLLPFVISNQFPYEYLDDLVKASDAICILHRRSESENKYTVDKVVLDRHRMIGKEVILLPGKGTESRFGGFTMKSIVFLRRDGSSAGTGAEVIGGNTYVFVDDPRKLQFIAGRFRNEDVAVYHSLMFPKTLLPSGFKVGNVYPVQSKTVVALILKEAK